MTEYAIHRPSFSGTTKNDWEFPTEENFDTDDLPAAADRFLLSASGFDDPDRFEDLELPVVNSRGYLSLNGLWAARRGPYSVEDVDGIDEETKAAVVDLIDALGTENFEGFGDVTVTDAEWAESTGGGPANPAGGIVNDLVGPSRPVHTPLGSLVGLGFLAGVAAVVARFDRE